MKVFERTPLNLDALQVPQGQVYIIPDRCKGCRICVELCPCNVLEISTAQNKKGYHFPQVIMGKEHACVHCEFCTMVCPEFAIFTLEVT